MFYAIKLAISDVCTLERDAGFSSQAQSCCDRRPRPKTTTIPSLGRAAGRIKSWSYREICLGSRQYLRTGRCRHRTQRGFRRGQRFLYKVQTVTQFLLVDDERRTNPQHIKAAEGVEVLALQIR